MSRFSYSPGLDAESIGQLGCVPVLASRDGEDFLHYLEDLR
jgi:hypothetical protein